MRRANFPSRLRGREGCPPCGSVLLLVALVFHAATTFAETGANTEQWKRLFNGVDLEGWQPKIKGYELGQNFADTFRVENGLLTVAYDGYDQFADRFGHLFYETPFSHYRLRVEYRFIGNQSPGGPGWAFRNSGLMIHGQAPETMKVDQDFPVSVEVQLLGGNGVDPRTTANLCTPGTHVEIEVKVPGNEPTERQFSQMGKWRAAGALVFWCTSAKECRTIMAEHAAEYGFTLKARSV